MNRTLEELQREFESSLAGLKASNAHLRADGNAARWSVQEIVEHLLLTYELSESVFEERVAKGRPTLAQPTLSQRVGQVVMLSLGQFPKGREAPERVRPKGTGESLSGEQLSAWTQEALERFDAIALKAERLFGKERAITHQVLGPMSVQGWRRFHLVHGRHHLTQVAALRLGHGA